MAMLSSPLAAMQPPPPRWTCVRDAPDSITLQTQSGSLSSTANFNFAELGMRKPQPDYFSLKNGSVRGSSPTASLAADLSQNFYIDQSPRVATPRRCLFQSGPGLFASFSQQEGATTPLRWEGVTTPPIPSSSPACGADTMDISPLPHKVPFSLASSKPDSPCRKHMGRDIGSGDSLESLESDRKNPTAERRRSHILRPSLSRSKCQSTSFITQSHHLPPFAFGAGGNGPTKTTATTTMSLEECFKESPLRSNLFSNQLPTAVRSRALNGFPTSRGNGSPMQNLARKCASAAQRPRKQFRRTLSMFEHPADIMKTEKTQSSLDAVMDLDESHELSLPNFIPDDKPDSLPRINQDTMISVLNDDYKDRFNETIVVDCRFEYEFNGGHINGAVNFNDKDHLAKQLFASPQTHRTLIILHCEYSAHRAPLMAQYIRQQDRTYNTAQYPKLTYPELYILDGGYSSFFKNHRARCFPQNYVEMDAKEHEQACERGLNKIRQRSKLSRAQTFAFGEQLGKIQESPSRHSTAIQEGQDVDMFSSRLPQARRMASY